MTYATDDAVTSASARRRRRAANRRAGSARALAVGTAAVVTAAGLSALPAGCQKPLPAPCSTFPADAPSTYAVTVSVIDDNGAPIAGARLDPGDEAAQLTTAAGVATFSALNGPKLLVASAAGFLSEPVPIGWTAAGTTVKVHLWSTLGGARWAMHNGGDSMFGRRYETPTNGSMPLIPASDPGDGAREVVAGIARAFSIADFKTVNLETTVTDRPDDSSYPGKRWILRTRPAALAALDALDVSVVGLANNHQRDYLDPGVQDTTAALDALSIPHVGANVTDAAEVPFASNVAGLKIGVLAFTGVDGTFVNDSYPADCAYAPPSLDDLGDDAGADAAGDFDFKYDLLKWGFSSSTITIPSQPRCIGGAWTVFEAAESSHAPTPAATDVNGAWASMAAVYPQMQDWVSRRGHGGAAP